MQQEGIRLLFFYKLLKNIRLDWFQIKQIAEQESTQLSNSLSKWTLYTFELGEIPSDEHLRPEAISLALSISVSPILSWVKYQHP